MSYSTRENLEDAEKSVLFAKELTELYPDARIVDGRWLSGNVPVSECDTVELVPYTHPGRERGTVSVFCGKTLASGGVIWSSHGFQAFRALPLFITRDSGALKDDALRRALLDWSAR